MTGNGALCQVFLDVMLADASFAYCALVTSLWGSGFVIDLEFNGNADQYATADVQLSPALFLGQRLFARHFLRYGVPAFAVPAYLTPPSWLKAA